MRRLGFFVLPAALAAASIGCGGRDAHAAARAADAEYRTGAFTWLVDHDPSAVVAWRVPAARLRALVPDSHVEAARGDSPCAQALRLHAALFVAAPKGATALRDRAEDCGFALFRDAGALVVAPR